MLAQRRGRRLADGQGKCDSVASHSPSAAKPRQKSRRYGTAESRAPSKQNRNERVAHARNKSFSPRMARKDSDAFMGTPTEFSSRASRDAIGAVFSPKTMPILRSIDSATALISTL